MNDVPGLIITMITRSGQLLTEATEGIIGDLNTNIMPSTAMIDSCTLGHPTLDVAKRSFPLSTIIVAD
jgi:hypothetical protein